MITFQHPYCITSFLAQMLKPLFKIENCEISSVNLWVKFCLCQRSRLQKRGIIFWMYRQIYFRHFQKQCFAWSSYPALLYASKGFILCGRFMLTTIHLINIHFFQRNPKWPPNLSLWVTFSLTGRNVRYTVNDAFTASQCSLIYRFVAVRGLYNSRPWCGQWDPIETVGRTVETERARKGSGQGGRDWGKQRGKEEPIRREERREKRSEKRRKGGTERDRRKDKWTAKQKGTGTWEKPERGWLHGGGDSGEGGARGGLCTRGRGEHGIKQPRHRIVKGKVLLLRPPTDSRLIGFKDELFGYLQRHVLKRTTTLASLYYLLRARATKGDAPSLPGNLHW